MSWGVFARLVGRARECFVSLFYALTTSKTL